MQHEEIVFEGSQLVAHDTSNMNNDPENGQNSNRQTNERDANNGNGGWQLHQSSHSTQIVAALAVSLGPLAAGLGKGYASPALASLEDSMHITREFAVTNQELSWLASLSLLGALFGGMFGGISMQYGRKRTLALMSLPFSATWILTMFAQSVGHMYITVFMSGFCCAIVSSCVQVYISEIASPEIRGFLSAVQKMAQHVGVLIAYLLGSVLDWRQLALFVSVAPMMLFVTVIYIPETPSYLVLKGRDEEAYRALQWLRPHKNVEIELETIRSNIRLSKTNLGHQHLSTATINGSTTKTNNNEPRATTTIGGTTQQQRSTAATKLKNFTTQISVATQTAIQGLYIRFRDLSFETLYSNAKAVLRNARLIKPVTITCGLMIVQRFTGASSFGFYSVRIFKKTFANFSPHTGSIAVGFVQLLASMLSGLLIDTVGRIPLLITSSVFMTLALASFGSYSYYEETNKQIADALDGTTAVGVSSDWIPLLCVLVFTVAFALGIQPISWLLVGELFPLEYRNVGSAIATSFSYFCAFIGVKTYVDLEELLGLYGTFWLYATVSCIGLFFVVMIVPETKGRDLDEMDPRFVRTLTINR
ncbi:facilitated trehalose transporter Tret1-like [Culicoides brevitarsis]|uniref:facilitated trehalose transporter Tret1-like n=1 Tax=Culicoides brevitarsis TaxID=469753 RepID=UPI00307CC0FA